MPSHARASFSTSSIDLTTLTPPPLPAAAGMNLGFHYPDRSGQGLGGGDSLFHREGGLGRWARACKAAQDLFGLIFVDIHGVTPERRCGRRLKVRRTIGSTIFVVQGGELAAKKEAPRKGFGPCGRSDQPAGKRSFTGRAINSVEAEAADTALQGHAGQMQSARTGPGERAKLWALEAASAALSLALATTRS